MALLGMFIDDEYLPEYGTLVLIDAYRGGDPEPPEGGEQLNPGALELLGGGTVAIGGFGWLHGDACDGYHRVALELHDGPPPPERAPWTDVAETSYLSHSGFVGLTFLTGGVISEGLELGGPGAYRVRVCSRAAQDEGKLWRLQFWAAEPEVPRWFARQGRTYDLMTWFTSDLVMIAAWSELTGRRWRLAELAEWLLVEPSVVREAFELTAAKGSVAVVGDLSGEFALTTNPPKEPAYTSGVTQSPAPGTPWDSPGYRPPAGPPPLAGIVGEDGTLTRWREGEPVCWPTVAAPRRAMETPHGVLVFAAETTVLLRPDGELLGLGKELLPGTARLDREGRWLTVEEHHIGRQSYRRRHQVDLTDGSRRMEWLPEYEWPTGPVSMPDSRSGLILTIEAQDRLVLTGPGGLRRELWLPGTARLAPGAAGLYTTSSAPPALTWFDLSEADPSGVVRWLPERTWPEQGLVWEAPDRVLLPLEPHAAMRIEARFLRVGLRTGQYEAVPGGSGLVVEPWFTVD
ncbi:hypothetical protein N8J89_21910 [Crossiella sp. CA-258035]|uniref:hypothetical protein n=1 Tax=Crossiella sp. CA-258035 TaxID=2981138 RepID=UPI0024BC00F9|nr:hypothetical protein [Crossiella sp. CA-258035]WHT15792.1 hypothetical protein N8J89_21910 [Crossiella sp. CA-258035]